MNDILFTLLRASITASLSDREAFINRLAEIIEAKTGKDEDAARNLSDHIAKAMEGLNGTLLLQQLFDSGHDKNLTKSLDNLSLSIEKLTSILKEAGHPISPSNNDEQ